MKKTLAELAALLTEAEIKGDENTVIEDIVNDSNEVQEGSLFVCFVGAHTDGHKYIPEAAKKGARAVMTELDIEPPEGLSVLKVPSLEKALIKIVPAFYDYPGKKMRLIGITGTNGKTTTSYLIRSILRHAGFKVGLIGTIKMMIEDESVPVKNTTPDLITLQRSLSRMKAAGMDYVVMEVSSHALAMNRIAGCEFDTAVFTNLTQDHLDYHKTLENYRAAKAKLFYLTSKKGLKSGKAAVVNTDDEAGAFMLNNDCATQLTYAINDKSAKLVARNIKVLPRGAEFELSYGEKNLSVKLKITGLFNVYNTLAAIGASLAEKVEEKYIIEALKEFEGTPGRFESVDAGQDFSVIVDYAHTPDGLNNILRTAREITEKNIITVFGCGGDRDKTKRPIMGRLAAELSDIVIETSDNPRTEDPEQILADVLVGVKEKIAGKHFELIADRREAIFRAIELAKCGDTVIIAGKGHENYQILKDKTIHFDDKETALEALGGKAHA